MNPSGESNKIVGSQTKELAYFYTAGKHIELTELNYFKPRKTTISSFFID